MTGVGPKIFDCQLQVNPLHHAPESSSFIQPNPNQSEHTSSSDQHSLQPKQLFDLVEDDDDDPIDAPVRPKLQIPKWSNICDFISDEQECESPTHAPKLQQKQNTILDFVENEDAADVVAQSQPAELTAATSSSQPFPVAQNYYALKESTLMKHTLPAGSMITFRILIQKNRNKTISYDLLFNNESVCVCTSSLNKFLFVCNEGPAAQMERENNVFSMLKLSQNYGGRHLTNARITIRQNILKGKRFSTMTARFGFFSKSRQTQIQEYSSKDPFINKDGKLELKIDTKKPIRPSSFNCVIENRERKEMCQFLLTGDLEMIVLGGFSPLMAFSLAVSRMDWSQQVQKRKDQ